MKILYFVTPDIFFLFFLIAIFVLFLVYCVGI